jgi:hypothetical protein
VQHASPVIRPAKSTLRGSDCSDHTHARLASRWRPALAGQDLNLLGCFRTFLSVMSLHITSIPLRHAAAPSTDWPFRGTVAICRFRLRTFRRPSLTFPTNWRGAANARRSQLRVAPRLCDRGDARLLLSRLSGSAEEIWFRVEPFVPRAYVDKASYAFDDLWDSMYGNT